MQDLLLDGGAKPEVYPPTKLSETKQTHLKFIVDAHAYFWLIPIIWVPYIEMKLNCNSNYTFPLRNNVPLYNSNFDKKIRLPCEDEANLHALQMNMKIDLQAP